MYLVVRRVGVLRARPRPTAAPAVFLGYRRLRVQSAVLDGMRFAEPDAVSSIVLIVETWNRRSP